jgi:hypothetical protein
MPRDEPALLRLQCLALLYDARPALQKLLTEMDPCRRTLLIYMWQLGGQYLSATLHQKNQAEHSCSPPLVRCPNIAIYILSSAKLVSYTAYRFLLPVGSVHQSCHRCKAPQVATGYTRVVTDARLHKWLQDTPELSQMQGSTSGCRWLHEPLPSRG